MPLTTRNWGASAAYPQAGPALRMLGSQAAAEVANAIGRLPATDFFGAPGATSITDVHGWRIDRQNAPTGFVNLSVQRNGAAAPSTVASVFVPTALNIAPGPGGPGVPPFAARIRELERAVRRGLEESFATHTPDTQGRPSRITRKQVAGTFSN